MVLSASPPLRLNLGPEQLSPVLPLKATRYSPLRFDRGDAITEIGVQVQIQVVRGHCGGGGKGHFDSRRRATWEKGEQRWRTMSQGAELGGRVGGPSIWLW